VKKRERDRTSDIRESRDRLRPILDTQIAALVNRVGASLRSVQVRELGYRWGACGHKGDLYFHWGVAMLPRVMIEYVVVHQLVHLIEPHHTNVLWDRVEWILSDWCDAYGGLRLRKQWLA
jgi:predicted metal-dependent hydrolase